jgi:ribonuclease P protein component
VPGASPVGRFPASARIRKRLEFRAAQDLGRRISTPHFILLLYARKEPGAPARLGVVASRRVGTAVVRNRAKRLVREAFRATRELWATGIDLVVIVRRPLDHLKLDHVASEWRSVDGLVRKRTAEARADRQARQAQDAGNTGQP